MQPKVLLATTVSWPSGARLAAAFAKVGCTVDAFAPEGAPVTRSRFVDAHRLYDVFAPLSSLDGAIAASKPDLIVPCDDRALAQLLALAEKNEAARPLISRSLGRLESYPLLMSRCDLIAAAADLGLRVAETAAVASEQQLSAAIARFGLPAALKLDGSWGGGGVALVHTPEEALAAFRRFCEPPARLRGLLRAVKRRDAHFAMAALKPQKPSLSLQRFIAGTPANTAFACWQGKVLAAVHVDVLQTQETNGPACVVRRVEDADMQEAAVRLAERFQLSGLHGLDFMRDREGRAHLIESNPRATQTAALALGEGRDLIAAVIAAATYARPVPRPAVSENPTIAFFPQEWARDPTSRWLTEAYHDVPWEDPAVLRAGLAPPPVPLFPAARALAFAFRGWASFTSWKPSRPSV
jgi:hypothetical protein